MNRKELSDRVASLPWWHRIDLGQGVVTPGKVGEQPAMLSPDLRGKTVLDVGAWDGMYSFAAERKGARRVLATDWFCWGHGGWGSKNSFLLAREALGSRVEDMDIDVMDLSPERVGRFDAVLFLGVLYHLRNPLRGLEKVAAVTSDMLILESHVDMTETPFPAARFYPGAELNNDDTNWWGPNHACIEAMLRTVGFKRVQRQPTFAPSRAIYHAFKS